MSRIVSDLIYRLIADETELVKGLKAAQAQAEASAKKFTETGKKLTLGLTVPIIGGRRGHDKARLRYGRIAQRR